ncbi:hypothetical protein B0H67DRAFT_561245 [Lasiosphaeris hirsuta]|uniref:SAM-dependent methyltransferase n=1 Tax=Lasiosphaeris hirsuta TaxID=260670 RepID=A0AA40B9V2_9PEZI|nr:hypothetical protein B0H67DRAFT_561245 [Lasiosphaeris hirsuta]
MPLPVSDAPQIASYAIQPSAPSPTSLAIEVSQAVHRINLINAWGPSGPSPGHQVLEIGCGQGTCTAALAAAVSWPPASPPAQGPINGHITALDPASPTYGAPFTLAQAQSHLSAGPVGSLITFHRADPVAFLAANPAPRWDTAILAHCIWYFPSPSTLPEILTALRGRVSRVCIAEWALRASQPSAAAHVLAALARATLEAHKVESEENIRNVVTPAGIKDVVRECGWRVESEGFVVPERELADGRWEVGSVVDEGFVQEVERVEGDRVRALLRSARDATVSAAEAVGGVRGVRSMDVWVATLVLD